VHWNNSLGFKLKTAQCLISKGARQLNLFRFYGTKSTLNIINILDSLGCYPFSKTIRWTFCSSRPGYRYWRRSLDCSATRCNNRYRSGLMRWGRWIYFCNRAWTWMRLSSLGNYINSWRWAWFRRTSITIVLSFLSKKLPSSGLAAILGGRGSSGSGIETKASSKLRWRVRIGPSRVSSWTFFGSKFLSSLQITFADKDNIINRDLVFKYPFVILPFVLLGSLISCFTCNSVGISQTVFDSRNIWGMAYTRLIPRSCA
jgi:hypothetical protein